MADHLPHKAPSYRYSESLPKVNLLSLYRSRVDPSTSPSTLDVATPSSTHSIPMRERPSAAERSPSSSPDESVPDPGPRGSVTQFCLCQPDPKIPRPRNAFILYRQHYQGAVVAQNPGLANPDISKIIGEQWRNLSQATKDEWKALAEEEKVRHSQQYPQYRYQPRRFNRDGSRSSSSGLSHNPAGATICNRCGGRIMNPPASPDTVFSRDSVSAGGARASHDSVMSRSYSAEQGPRGMKHGSHSSEHRGSRARQWEESGSISPDSKRRRTNPHVQYRPDLHRDRSPPNSPYGVPPYAGRTDSISTARGLGLSMQAPRGLHPVKEHPQSGSLPPLHTAAYLKQSSTNTNTPVSAFPREAVSLETAVNNIPFLSKIKILGQIAPQLPLSFHEGDPRRRGPVIAVDGQNADLVKTVTEYLHDALQKEGKLHPRIFEGPEISDSQREGSAEPVDTASKQMEYYTQITKWRQISEKIKSFVKVEGSRHPSEAGSGHEEETGPHGSPRISPRTIIPKTTEVNMSSPPESSETGSESAGVATPVATPPETVTTHAESLPVAIVPQYQLTTSDAYSCMVPIDDSYSIPDHWQWCASLWRGHVGPDITVYVRECDPQEMKQFGGPVEIRFRDAKTVVVRRLSNSPKELEEKVLKRLSFEIEDYLTQ
ncbi:hypothetical protein BDV19DRAFT_392482 [Aspergillus venezuelensis]